VLTTIIKKHLKKILQSSIHGEQAKNLLFPLPEGSNFKINILAADCKEKYSQSVQVFFEYRKLYFFVHNQVFLFFFTDRDQNSSLMTKKQKLEFAHWVKNL
jgi:hypothetical protein